MEKARFDRRLSRRLSIKTPLRVRIWKSTAPEQRAESLCLSRNGVFFATDSPIQEGETVEILLKMPEEITAEPTTEWRCKGHVVLSSASIGRAGNWEWACSLTARKSPVR
jgi:hypothetical protein